MADLLFLGFFSLCLSFLNGQSMESIPSSPVLKSPGEILNLSCKGTGYTFTSYGINWIRQATGKPLEWMGWINTNTGAAGYAKSLEGRVELTKEDSVSMTHLKLSGLKAEDSAVYYCAREDSGYGYYFDYWGKGTEVTVTSATATPPTLFPLAQCGSGTRDMLTLGCMATGFTPPSITFKWKDSTTAALTDFIQYPSVQSNGMYMGVSQLSIKKEDWDTKDFVCAVEHSAGNKEVTLRKPVPPPPISPSLYVMTPSKEEMRDNQTASFACLASGFSPKEYKITWLKNNKPIIEEVTDFCQDEQKGQGTTLYSATSFLKVNESDWTDLSEYTCQFEHITGTQTKTVKYEKGDGCVVYDLEFNFNEPTSENIFLEEVFPITCEVKAKEKGFTSIKWMKEDKSVIYEDRGEHLKNTFTVSAQITITKNEWNKGTPFICSVEHKDHLGSEQKTYQRNNGEEQKHPAVFLLSPAEDVRRNMVTLTCYVKDFYPKEVLVAWLVDDELVQMDSQKYKHISSSTIETGKTYYSIYSQLTMSMDDWKVDGVFYSCAVYHETIPKTTKMVVRTVDRTSNEPNLVNLSLNVPCCKP